MLHLVRSRHAGDGWIVFPELANTVGFGAKRTADAVALGVWSSTKYEAHLYEFKISRGDLKRELADHTKAEGVGRYCHYWWLVVDDEKRLSNLVVPERWGILVAKKHGDGHRLVQHRKAPKLSPVAFNPSFVVSCIRNIHKNFKSADEYAKVLGEIHDLKHGKPRVPTDEEYDDREKVIKLERELKHLKDYIKRFEENSGVELGEPSYDWGHIGAAVKIVRELGEMRRHGKGDVSIAVRQLSEAAERMEDNARQLARDAVILRRLMPVECAESCRSKSSWGRGRCNCGAQPLSEVERKLAADASLPSTSSSDCFVPASPTAIALATATPSPVVAPAPWAWKDDDEGGGSDSGGAGQDQQDAGGELRDQRHEVSNG